MIKFTDSVKNIAFALAQFQGETINPPKRKTAEVPMKNGGKFTYNYADLADVVETIRPALSKHGLAFIQNQVESPKGTVAVYTQLLHKSGESMIFDPVTVPLDKPTAQGIGAALTYARRYSLCTALGIAADEDTDGQTEGEIKNRKYKESSQNKKSTYKQPQQTTKPTKEETTEEPAKANEETMKELATKWKQSGGSKDELSSYAQNKYRKTIDELTEKEAQEIIAILDRRIEKQKKEQGQKKQDDSGNFAPRNKVQRVIITGKKAGVGDEQQKELILARYGLTSRNHLTLEQANELIKEFQEMTEKAKPQNNQLTEAEKQALISGFENDIQNMQAMGANSY